MSEVECLSCTSATQDECNECYGNGYLPRCVSCGDGITGCIWSGGRCLDCHERSSYAFACEVCGSWGACAHA
jgi:hypothetical protein